jgi:SAM-dependent methyltransferase
VKYKLVPDDEQEAEGLKANPTAQALFDPFLPLIQARSLTAAAKLDIFDQLDVGSATAADLAESLSLDSGVLELLLRILCSAGYVSKAGDQFRLTDLALRSLCSKSPQSLSGWLKLNHLHWDAIAALEQTLKTGRSIDSHRHFAGDESWQVYQQAMLETALPAAKWVASQMPIKEGAERMLDIGGAHGLYGAMICREHPPLRSEVLELPEAVEHARRLADRSGIADVVSHRAGDALTEELGHRTLDAVFLGNLLHHFTAEQNQELLARVHTALKEGGTVAIWDFNRPDSDSPPDLIKDGFALFFRISSAGDCYAVEQFRKWLEEAGFTNLKTSPAPTHVLVTGRKIGQTR